MRIIQVSLLLFWSSCAALIAQPSEQLYQLLHLDELVEIVSEEGLADANATADAYLQGVTRGSFGASIAKIYDKNSLTSRVKAMFVEEAWSQGRLVNLKSTSVMSFFALADASTATVNFSLSDATAPGGVPRVSLPRYAPVSPLRRRQLRGRCSCQPRSPGHSATTL